MGYENPAKFGATLALATSDLTPLEIREARFASNPTEAGAARMAAIRETKGEYAAAVEYYRQAGKLGGSTERYAGEILMAQAGGMRSKLFTFDDVKATADGILAAKSGDQGDLLMTAALMTRLSRRQEKPEMAVPYLRTAVEATEGVTDPDLVAERKGLLVDHALLVLEDKDKAVSLKRAGMPEGWMEDSGALNGFAWWCYENKVNLEEAEALARKGAGLAPPGKEKAMILDTVAEICLARGGCQDAVALSEEALANDPQNDYYKKQLERFQKELAAKTGK